MIDITTSRIFNEINQEHIMLYVEWFDSSFKMILLKPKVSAYLGEMSVKDINYFSEELSKSTSEYLKETKNSFEGNNADIQFFVKNEQGKDATESWKFEWKRKKIWTYGRVILKPIQDMSVITEIFNSLSKQYRNIKMKLLSMEEENESLKGCEKNLKYDIEMMSKMKENIEKDLCKKFLLILNAKKKKIVQLEDELDKYNNKNCPFDVGTDESEKSNKVCNGKKVKISQKRKLSNKKEDLLKKKSKTDSSDDDENFGTSPRKSSRTCKRKAVKIKSTTSDSDTESSLDTKHKISNINNLFNSCSNLKTEISGTWINSKTGRSMDLNSDSETDCSIELQVSPDSSLENPIRLGTLNITAEESEEDIFSQGESKKLVA